MPRSRSPASARPLARPSPIRASHPSSPIRALHRPVVPACRNLWRFSPIRVSPPRRPRRPRAPLKCRPSLVRPALRCLRDSSSGLMQPAVIGPWIQRLPFSTRDIKPGTSRRSPAPASAHRPLHSLHAPRGRQPTKRPSLSLRKWTWPSVATRCWTRRIRAQWNRACSLCRATSPASAPPAKCASTTPAHWNPLTISWAISSLP